MQKPDEDEVGGSAMRPISEGLQMSGAMRGSSGRGGVGGGGGGGGGGNRFVRSGSSSSVTRFFHHGHPGGQQSPSSGAGMPMSAGSIPVVNSLGSMPRISSHGSMPSFNSQGSMPRINSQGSIPTPMSPAGMMGAPQVWEGVDDERSILSYFLGADGNPTGMSPLHHPGAVPVPMNYPGTQTDHHHHQQQHQQQQQHHHQQQMPPPPAMPDAMECHPPTTPAVQFYSSSSSKHSSGSLHQQFPNASSAASSILRPPPSNQQQQQQQQQQQEQGQAQVPSDSAGPVQNGVSSSVGMSSQMLPPPPRLPMTNLNPNVSGIPRNTGVTTFSHPGSMQESQQQPQHSQTDKEGGGVARQSQDGEIQRQRQQQQQHVEWLRHMNAWAMRARQGQGQEQPSSSSTAGAATLLPRPPPGTTVTFQQQNPQQQTTQQQQQHGSGNSPPPQSTQQGAAQPHGMQGGSMPTPSTMMTSHAHGTTHVHVTPTMSIMPPPSASTSAVIRPSSSSSSVDTAASGMIVPTGSMVVTPAAAAVIAHSHAHGGASADKADNDERRARRLARNRESARQSRRRKKENLQFLGDKVNKLHTEIEGERRKQLAEMEVGLGRRMDAGLEGVTELMKSSSPEGGEETKKAAKERLSGVLVATALDSAVRVGVANFQYRQMRQFLIPKHHQFFLWLSLQHDPFFLAAKEMRSKATGRVSSKQIGEELTMTHQASAGGRAGSTSSGGARQGGKVTLTCRTGDVARFWPLLCYELSLSADQEERFRVVQGQIRSKEQDDDGRMHNARTRLSTAASMTLSLRKGVVSHCEAASRRRQLALLEVLTPEQSVRYLKWSASNKERCRSVRAFAAEESESVPGPSSLNELCIQLDRTLNIDKRDER